MAATTDSSVNALLQTPPSPSPITSTTAVDSLQSLEQLHLLDEIDKLRAYGVNSFVSFPQLVVCGDQSSGKSSVLEAITEIPFPRKDNLCTRFATKIVLRRGPKTKMLIKILADNKRPESERKKLEEFTGDLDLEDFGNLPDLIDAAQEAMGIAPGGVAFSRDVLSVEVTGPKRPQFTIIDLPGLTHSESQSQSHEDAQLVSELVHEYMRDPRTIILAVITAKGDYTNQIILKQAKEVDPEGVRTLGIITKPDMLPVGSDNEEDFLVLAKNEDIFFKLGWHVLRNRSHDERGLSFEARNRVEQTFFGKGVWVDLPQDTVGIPALRSRLSSLLLNCIKQELPRVYQEIIDELKDCESRLRKLGPRRSTVDEQRIFLSKMSENFGRLCKAAIDGIYEDGFFGDTTTLEGQLKRLRAVIQSFNSSFAQKVRTQGHLKQVVDEGEEKETTELNTPERITQEEAISWVKPLLLRSRGHELPGSYNHLLIGELFWEQSKPWESISRSHLERVLKTCRKFLQVLLQDITPTSEVLDSLLSYWVDDELRERSDMASKELDKLLTDRRRHAITYNHSYIENIQKARKERLEQRYLSIIKSVTGFGPWSWGPITVDSRKLLDVLTAPNMMDMDDYACNEVLDGMTAFYKTASQVFIDNVAIHVIERQVLDGLWDIFSPSSVAGMTTELISNIAAEPTEDQRQRYQLEAKQKSLQGGLKVCRGALKGVKTDPRIPHRKPSSSDDLESLLAGIDFSDHFPSKGGGVVRDSGPDIRPATGTFAIAAGAPSGFGTKYATTGPFPPLFATDPAATGSTSGSLFGTKSATTGPSSLFATEPAATGNTSGSLFRTKSTTTGPSSLFAMAPVATGNTSGSLFGAKSATTRPPPSLFATEPATTRPSPSLFATEPTTTKPPPSLFATKPPMTGNTSGSLFGMKSAAGAGPKANKLFGALQEVPSTLEDLNPRFYEEKEQYGNVTNTFQTITFMPPYRDYSVEELRVRDYEICNQRREVGCATH